MQETFLYLTGHPWGTEGIFPSLPPTTTNSLAGGCFGVCACVCGSRESIETRGREQSPAHESCEDLDMRTSGRGKRMPKILDDRLG